MPGPRVLALLLLAAAAHAQEASIRSRDPVAWWPLDEVAEQGSSDRASRVRDRLEGNYRLVDGVVGKAVSFDGYTTVLRRVAASAPALADAFTIEAWVAVGAYPWNVVPIVDHGDEQLRGFVFGLGPRGELSLRIAVDGRWLEATSPDGAVPLRQWSHVAARYDASAGLALFVDGRIVGRQVPPDPAGLGGRSARRGRVIPADGLDLLVGAVRAPRRPIPWHRYEGTRPSWYSLDGVLDELKIYDVARSDAEIAQAASHVSAGPPPLAPRVFPSGPKGPGRFGAYFAKLRYYPEWDALWRVGPDPDVLVRFDSSPVRVVFWRGTQYSPVWVTDNDLWMADQSVEGYDADFTYEHMNDKQNRYSHVRIIEASDARAVVHWRYALVNVKNEIWNTQERPGNGDERRLLELVETVNTTPLQTTGQQVLAFLQWIWISDPPADAVRTTLPHAYEYLRVDVGTDADLKKAWELVRSSAKVFTHRRRWTLICGHDELFLDDSGETGFAERIPNIELATARHLGATAAEQIATADLLDLRLLSSRYRDDVLVTDEIPVPPHWQNGFRAVQARLRGSLGQRDDEAEAESGTAPERERPTLALKRYRRIQHAFLDQGNMVSAQDVNAALTEDSIAVAGEPWDFAPELATILFDRWGLGGRRDLVKLMPRYVLLLARIADCPETTVGETPSVQEQAPPVQEQAETPLPSEPGGTIAATERRGGTSTLEPPPPEAAASPPLKGGSHTADDRERMIKGLQRNLDALRAVGITPTEGIEDDDVGSEREFGRDDDFRMAALQFERDEGRFPVEKPARQAGHDIDSYSHDVGHPERRLVRRIEVKGRNARWEGEQTVELSDRQFLDALGVSSADPEEAAAAFDYWLYVVEPHEGRGHRVLTIRNPARKARRFELRGGTWRGLAE